MLLDQATGAQMQAARILTGATMVGFLAAPMFGRRARLVRIMVAAVYLACVLGFIACVAY
jgi:hypothetical protein